MFLIITTHSCHYTFTRVYRVTRDVAEFVDTHLKLALGGESPHLRDTALDTLLLVGYDRELAGRFIRPWNSKSLCRSESCTPDALNWRSVYGLAVTAALFLYMRCRLCGVAAPGLLVLLMSPPRFRMDATSSAHKQTGALSVSNMKNSANNCVFGPLKSCRVGGIGGVWGLLSSLPAQKNESPVVCLGNRMERAMPMFENGLPTKDSAWLSMVCSAFLEQPSDR